jgi:hypothetical protein
VRHNPRYSDHASRERIKAGVTRDQVRVTIKAGAPWPVATIPGSPYHGKQRRFGSRVLRVIYLEGPRDIYVITVYWEGVHD